VSHFFGLEQLEAAAEIIANGHGTSRHRLASAWADHLSRVDAKKDLPAEVRGRFRALPMFGREAKGFPVLLVASLNEEELRAASVEIIAIRDRVRHRLGERG
jgi:hypothetical protein